MDHTDCSVNALIVGDSQSTTVLRLFLRRIAASSASVLITGETGVGKELVAQSIYAYTRTGPFIAVDCGALPASLIESELFGHERGAFTGATGARRGLIEQADGGTLFLDEVGELPSELQAKLLRTLQEGEIRPLGAAAPRRVKLRVIAATNKDLAKAIKEGQFREDLYYRLNVIPVAVAPLRMREDDILPLANHFLKRAETGHRLCSAIEEAFLHYSWPGNVRQLGNFIKRMVALSDPLVVPRSMIPVEIMSELSGADLLSMTAAVGTMSRAAATVCASPAAAAQQPRNISASPAHLDTWDEVAYRLSPGAAPELPCLEAIEQLAIEKALVMTRGDRTKAALLLGMGRTTLYRKLLRNRGGSAA